MIHRPALAWFSPMPPVRCGPATDSARLVPALGQWFDIDVFVDGREDGHRAAPAGIPVRSAHDFVWLHRQAPYDLTVYQLGNAAVHDYMWPYLFRYPGLVVLHDACVHHARAASLLRQKRAADYRAEFIAAHPDASEGMAELAVAGFDSPIHYLWPMTRLIAARSRVCAVHARPSAEAVRAAVPAAVVEAIALAHGTPGENASGRARVRARYGIGPDTVVFGCFGGLSPEKRLPQILAAFAATRANAPSARLLLAGAVARHYDLEADIRRHGLDEAVIAAGYIDTDDELDAHIAACDAAVNLRWPTAREISGPWLRCLAAGVATVITQLSHLREVPWLDPRTWEPATGGADVQPVCVGIDILDEDHSLRLAMRRLARDPALRRSLGAAGFAWWHAHHSIERMIDDYRRVIALAIERPAPSPEALPAHLIDDGAQRLERLLEPFEVANPLR